MQKTTKASGPGPALNPEVVRDVQLRANRCPYCHSDVGVEAEDSVVCQSCLARHHLDCWDEGGACSACMSTRRFAPEPARELKPTWHWEGQDLVLRRESLHGTELPHIDECLLCSSSEDLETHDQKFVYFNPWFWLTLFVNWILTFVLYFVLRKKETVCYPLCGECRSTWSKTDQATRWAILGGGSVFLTFVMLGVMFFGVFDWEGLLVGGTIGLGTWASIYVLARFFAARGRPSCRRITDRQIVLRVPRPERLKEQLGFVESATDL